MSNTVFYIERRVQGDYAVKKANAARPSAIAPTQGEAIRIAKKLNPEATIHVERVRNIPQGKRDKWRRP